MPFLLLLALFVGEADIRSLVARRGSVTLPAGTIVLNAPLEIPEGTRITGHAQGTQIRASHKFRGRALLIIGSRTAVTNLTLDGNRSHLAKTLPIAPYDRSFASFYDLNGILSENTHDVLIRSVELRHISNFAILIRSGRRITIDRAEILNSGSLNGKSRNNTTGGILLEEGTTDFTVRDCDIRSVRGNGIWTHSRYTSARNARGSIFRNSFTNIGRDAIQAGHATEIQVEGNTGSRIGYPANEVDVENGGTPVAIDTAGNVDKSVYASNRFEDINGKCIDLDGFHDGEVRSNTCINVGHYAIVFNNTNPDMQSRNIRVIDNVIDGAKYGGIFVIGEGHTITGNRMTRLNLAGCDPCLYDKTEPDLLQAGIYLGSKAERPDLSRKNTIKWNRITGYKMAERCIIAGPGVAPGDQRIQENECTNTN